jgi:hypothetical protein
LLALYLMARLLLGVPESPAFAVATARTRLYFVRAAPRAPVPASPSPPRVPPDAAEPQTARETGMRRAPPVETRASAAAPSSSIAESLYTSDGRVRLRADAADAAAAGPPGAPDARAQQDAKRILERPDPVEYRETVFDKAKRERERADRQSKVEQLLYGKDIQHAVARPPPDVRFDPALHENAADLGSEATGDAYKAAPVAHEPRPQPNGEAGRRIRAALADLRQRGAGCERATRERLLAPVSKHLQDLEQAEYGMAHGADPVLAEHLLPRQADDAYDMARRALWYARRKLAACSN